MRCPKIWMIWDRCIFRVDALRRGIEEMKAFARDSRYYFRRCAAPRKRFADAEQAAGARNRCENGFGIERFNRAKIDNFYFKTITNQFLGDSKGFMQHRAISDNGKIASFTYDPRLTSGQAFLGRKFVGLEMVIKI